MTINVIREATVKIPEKRFEFFMELFEQLGIEMSLEFEITGEHKAIGSERIKNSKSEDLNAWEDTRKTLKFKTE